ncbi:HU family DNA-binding protein [Cetobacterium sp. SF1]|uniref:HU family DNA-binding protein n=1 Tax=unclassified Cetobacterium TaxID=2630983 RepID=UPI003CF447B5
MTKKEFIDLFQAKSGLETKTQTEKVLTAMLESLEEVLVKGEEVSFLGFGKFEVVEKAARTGRNPKTGEEIAIPAKKAAKFKPGKALSEKLNG